MILIKIYKRFQTLKWLLKFINSIIYALNESSIYPINYNNIIIDSSENNGIDIIDNNGDYTIGNIISSIYIITISQIKHYRIHFIKWILKTTMLITIGFSIYW